MLFSNSVRFRHLNTVEWMRDMVDSMETKKNALWNCNVCLLACLRSWLFCFCFATDEWRARRNRHKKSEYIRQHTDTLWLCAGTHSTNEWEKMWTETETQKTKKNMIYLTMLLTHSKRGIICTNCFSLSLPLSAPGICERVSLEMWFWCERWWWW